MEYTTQDGGRTWHEATTAEWLLNGEMSNLRFLTLKDGYLLYRPPVECRPPVLLWTHNGGATWNQQYPAVAPGGLLTPVDANIVFGIGTALDAGAVLRSDDGGQTWKQVGSLQLVPSGRIIALQYVDPQHDSDPLLLVDAAHSDKNTSRRSLIIFPHHALSPPDPAS